MNTSHPLSQPIWDWKSIDLPGTTQAIARAASRFGCASAPLLGALLFVSGVSRAMAQTAPKPPVVALQEEAITLSPFEVKADKDVGYQASNTTSGSRLNTALKDTAAAITPFTREFLEDLGATSLERMMDFAANYEPDFNDNEGFNGIAARQADTTNAPFRIRGQMGGVSIDLAETGVPVDLSQVERVEIASGPNSILFGTGAVGGLISLSTKRASVERTFHQIRGTLGSWSFHREELDSNVVLRKGVASVRIFGVNEDGEGWRYWDFRENRRLTGTFTLRPWRQTTLSASYGRGEIARHMTTQFNGGDQITLWNALGRQLGGTATVANLVARGTDSYGGTRRFTFIENDGAAYNMQNALISRGYLPPAVSGVAPALDGISNNGNNWRRLLSPDLMPYDYSVAGPGARFTSAFNSAIARLEQRVGEKLTIEAAYQRNRADNASMGYNLATGSNMAELRGDPNLTLTPISGAAVANPRAGQLYMETNWRPQTFQLINEVARVTAAYELDLGRKFGQHRFAFLGEEATLDRQRSNKVQILVDQNNVPIQNADTPENQANQFFRRNYVKEGDYRTYYMSDPSVALPPMALGSRQFTARDIVVNASGAADDSRETKSLMFAMQNYWFNRRFVTTFGIRRDTITFLEAPTGRVSAADPLVTSGRLVANEWYLAPVPKSVQERDFGTRTMGGVYHLSRRLSVFYNNSNNVGTPRFDRTVIGGALPPPAEGQGQDAGLMIDVCGDDRYYVRLTAFETSQVGDASIAPGGAGNPNNYYTRSINLMLQHLLDNRRITRAEYDAQAQSFSAMTVDTASRGFELEFVANPTPNWTLRASASYTTQQRENFFSERDPVLSNSLAFIRSKDDKLPLDPITPNYRIENEIAYLLGEIATAEQGAEGVLPGARELKANLSGRYRWSAGRLKGVFLGGAVTYQGKPLMQESPTGEDIYGKSVTQLNLFVGQSWRLPISFRPSLRLQLNVNNATNSAVVTPGRYDYYLTGLRRVYMRTPREFRLAATVDF